MAPPTPHVHPTAGDAQHPQSFTFLGSFRAFEVAVTSGHILHGVWAWRRHPQIQVSRCFA